MPIRPLLLSACLVAGVAACSSMVSDVETPRQLEQAEVSWTETQTLVPADGADENSFGLHISAGPNVVAIGASVAKAIYVFEREGMTWTQKAKLVPPPDGKPSTEFGETFTLAGSHVFVTRRTTDDSFPTVIVFARSADGWTMSQELVGDPNATFGSMLASSGTTLIVGGFEAPKQVGNAYVFELEGEAFVRRQKLVPPSVDVTPYAFGSSAALGDGLLVVGSLDEQQILPAISLGGAIYTYSKGALGWELKERYPTLGSDVRTLCFAGSALAYGKDNATAGVRRRTATGFVDETTLSGTGGDTDVLCDGNRVAVSPFVRAEGGVKLVRIFSPVGASWGPIDVPLGENVDNFGFAMSGGVIFASGGAPAGRFVRVVTFGNLLADACTSNDQCASRFCVDGLCCDSACGGGTNDCQACSRAAGAAADGKCGAVAATHVCREARGGCDVADFCDGTNGSCPADLVAPNGTSCGAGICTNGGCVDRDASVSENPNPPGGGDESSNTGCSVAHREDASTLGLGVLFVVAAVARSARRRVES